MHSNWPEHVLCPVDFSPPSAAALRLAGHLVEATHAGLTILHAHHWEAPPYFTPSQIAELNEQFGDAMREADRALEEFAGRVYPNLRARRMVVDAAPADAILRAARENAVDLVVMGTHGRSGFNRFLLGSVAERLLREATIPIVTVRAPATGAAGPQPVRRILCPINDSQEARHSLQTAARLASSLKAELIALHVIEKGVAERPPDPCGWLSEQERKACDLQSVVESGDAAGNILRAATNLSADLLVIAARRRPFADALIVGSTTVRVVRHSPAPVLTIPAPQPFPEA